MSNFDSRAWFKKRYAEEKAAGVCPACHKNKASETSVYCLPCLTKQRARQAATANKKDSSVKKLQAEIREEHRKNSACLACGGIRYSKLRCRKHYALYLVGKGWTRHEARKHVGLCTSCDAVLLNGVVRCDGCSTNKRRRHAERKAKRICTICGEMDARDAKTTCQKCSDKKVELYAERKANGKCPHCGNDTPIAPGKHCAGCQKTNRKKDRKKRRKLRRQILEAYGGACKCCNETTVEFLQVDHINNDGAAHRKEIGGAGSLRLYSWLRRRGFPKEGFQLLCANCNYAKSRYGRCPHLTKKGR